MLVVVTLSTVTLEGGGSKEGPVVRDIFKKRV